MRKHEELSNVTARFIALFAEQSEANAAESQIQGPKSECQVQRFEVWGFGAMGHGALLLRCGSSCWSVGFGMRQPASWEEQSGSMF